MKPLKKLLCCLLALSVIVSMFTIIPIIAEATDGISYIDENGEVQHADNVTELTEQSGAFSLNSGWYMLKSDLVYEGRINAAGDVHIILCDGYTLTAHKGITVHKTSDVTRHLTIYAQSKDADEMGALVIDDVADYYPGIGSISTVYGGGTITINGGKITVTGGKQAAGIGGREKSSCESITINGGIINATGGSDGDIGGAGIGGGYYKGCDVTINGGTVKATGGAGAAGIGGGLYSADHSTVTINGGNVTATGTSGGAGIGSGRCASGNAYEMDSDAVVTINGGNVTATGGVSGAGIGGGQNSKGSVTINGGTVKANRGTNTASHGIGNGVFTSGSISSTEGSVITLSWTDAEKDNYTATNYAGKVTLEKYFTDRNTEIYSRGKLDDNSIIGGKTIYPYDPGVKKVWDVGDVDDMKPASVQAVIQAYQSSAWTTKQTVTLNADNNWEAAFNDFTAANAKSCLVRVRELDKDNHVVEGGKVSYTVTRNGGSAQMNYHVTNSIDQSGRSKVTNKLDVRTLKITKKWDIDLEGKDHPESVEMQIQEKKNDKWENVQVVTLSANDNDEDKDWKASVAVPKYRYDGDDEEEIEYRVRELKEKSLYKTFMNSIKDLVDQGKDTYEEWTSKLKTEGQEVYNMLPGFIRDAMNDSYESLCQTLGLADSEVHKLFDKLMEILGPEADDDRIVYDEDDDDFDEGSGDDKKISNRVTYNVGSYNSVVGGGDVDNHSTVYKVKYEVDGDETTVTNQAIQIIDLHKWWIPINVDDDDMPDSAWLVLMFKPSAESLEDAKNMASAAGFDTGKVLDYDFPVLAPLEGGMGPFQILGEAVLGIDLSFLDDLFSLPKVGIVKVTEDDKWMDTIVDTKYICGIPKEYRGAELVGEVLHQLIKYLTDGVVDLPISYNPFSNYITISTKAIPALRWMSLDDFDLSKLIAQGKTITQQDLDNFKPQDLIFNKNKLMTNIINVKFAFDFDDDDDDDDSLRVTKVWSGDDESKRPDWIKIHVKDGGEEIEGSPITLNKSDFSDNIWYADLDLDDDVDKKALTLSEEYPSDYQYKDSYVSTTIGTMIVNVWEAQSTNIIGQKTWKDDDDAAGRRPEEITVNLLADGEKVDSVTANATNGWKYAFSDKPAYKTENNNKVRINYTVTEEPVEGYTAAYDGYNIINTLSDPDCKLTITATRPASAADKEQSFVYSVTGGSVDLTVAVVLEEGDVSGSVTIAGLTAGTYTVAEEDDWSWRYSDGGSQSTAVSDATAAVTFAHTKTNNDWLNGYSHRETQ